jgi:hypothetical protein
MRRILYRTAAGCDDKWRVIPWGGKAPRGVAGQRHWLSANGSRGRRRRFGEPRRRDSGIHLH